MFLNFTNIKNKILKSANYKSFINRYKGILYSYTSQKVLFKMWLSQNIVNTNSPFYRKITTWT